MSSSILGHTHRGVVSSERRAVFYTGAHTQGRSQMFAKDFDASYCLSKKSFPLVYIEYIMKIRQNFFDIQYILTNQRLKN